MFTGLLAPSEKDIRKHAVAAGRGVYTSTWFCSAARHADPWLPDPVVNHCNKVVLLVAIPGTAGAGGAAILTVDSSRPKTAKWSLDDVVLDPAAQDLCEASSSDGPCCQLCRLGNNPKAPSPAAAPAADPAAAPAAAPAVDASWRADRLTARAQTHAAEPDLGNSE